MPDTRIILRNDTTANWQGSGATDLAKGELALRIDEVTDGSTKSYFAELLLGVDPLGAPIEEAVYVGGGGVVINTGIAESGITQTTPIVFKDIASKEDGTTVRWDDTNSKWVADAKVLSLDAYPTADGTVVYDATLGKFKVGAVVTATEIDGGAYP